jgi:hypothetical protein
MADLVFGWMAATSVYYLLFSPSQIIRCFNFYLLKSQMSYNFVIKGVENTLVHGTNTALKAAANGPNVFKKCCFMEELFLTLWKMDCSFCNMQMI